MSKFTTFSWAGGKTVHLSYDERKLTMTRKEGRCIETVPLTADQLSHLDSLPADAWVEAERTFVAASREARYAA